MNDKLLAEAQNVFTFMFLRYLILAGVAYFLFYILLKDRINLKKIQSRFPAMSDVKREVLWSLLTLTIFTINPLILFSPLVKPYTLVYANVEDYGTPYLIFSFFALILLHDAYFYWTHRLMHHPKLFRYFHLVHHQSVNPTPWAASSFHPLEAIVETGIVTLAVFIFPLHQSVLLAFILFMTAYSVYGHLGYELYPKWVNKNFFTRWMNTSVNHNLHHKHFKGNYGLYFRFWDELMGTTRKEYDQTFEEITTVGKSKVDCKVEKAQL